MTDEQTCQQALQAGVASLGLTNDEIIAAARAAIKVVEFACGRAEAFQRTRDIDERRASKVALAIAFLALQTLQSSFAHVFDAAPANPSGAER